MKKRRARSGFSFSGQAAAAAGGGGGGSKEKEKEKEKAKAKGRVLLKYEALPEYLKDNEFIRDYYRCEWPLKDVVLSIFSLHNETLNIWTHFLGFMIFMGMMLMNLTEKMSIENVIAIGERSDGWLTSKTIYRSNASNVFFTVLRLAFALMDEESLASWRWFLRMLSKYLLPSDDDRVCLISDMHAGLINAINYVPAFKFSRGVHRFYLRHVCLNFNTKFKNIQLKDMCWRAGAKDNSRKFDRIMEEIKSLNEESYDWLGRIDKAQWTLAHDGSWRTGILTTNMSECINGVLKVFLAALYTV
ncbi:uncharacterized protein LOC105155400 isoform X2 [Sesamum indicum]|uniref:Uncharacterized protein LOC105155400 isoform X2 n=1 Tax=Sesamum indicum TaxID=4182 RepID=A0A8M8VE71_SESIN|nr:uncharacterized protein LOC105155400 isoform X2 [Sesamum indicum]